MERIVEFRAGKMVLDGSQVRADPRKGLFRIAKCEEGLIHVQWLDRASLSVEDDQIVFPDEAVFEKVQQSSGRVYILKFNSDDRKLFFWIQEPGADRDEELCDSVNYYLNVTHTFIDNDENRAVPGDDPAVDAIMSDANINNNSNNNGSNPVQLSELQRILSNLGSAPAQESSSMFRDPGPSLSDVLKPDIVLPLLDNCHLEDRLSAYLPEGNWTLDSIAELMESTQFRQQLDMFTLAIRSGRLDFSQFGIDPSQCDFTVASFLEAIENQVAAKPENVDEATKRDVEDMKEQ